MRKVALLTGTYSAFSGIDRVVEQQAKQLASEGHQVGIVAFAADMPAPKGVELIVLSAPKSNFMLRVYRLIYPFLFWRWLRDLHYLKPYTEVHVQQYPLTILGWWAKRKYGARYIFHDYGIPPWWSFPSLIDRVYMMFFHIFSTVTIRPADQAYSISKFLQRELEKTTGLKSEILLPTIDTKRFSKNISGEEVRKRFGIPAADPLLLFVGRVVPYKGVHLLIESLRIVQQKYPNTRLLIAGKPTFPSYAKRLQELADDHVIFAGYVSDEDLPHFYAASTIYVTASSWEGYDLPIAEAQATGKPVVAYDIGSHPEVIDKYGILVPKGEVNAFGQAVVKILDRTL